MASSSSAMAVDAPKPPKLDVDEYLSTALTSTPAELHPFFEAFKNLHRRKYVSVSTFRHSPNYTCSIHSL
jgi:hypothetical protein